MGEDGSLMPRWHLSRAGKQHGPFSDQELLRLAQSGKLKTNDLLWRPGFETWQPISSVPGVLTPPGPGISPPPSPASALTNDETVRWIDRLPHRWTRNGAIIGLLWCLPFLALEIREKTDSSAAVAGLLLVAGLVGGLACLTGLAARRRLRRIVSLDVGEALSALRKLPREFAIWGAGAGVLLAILIGDWQRHFHGEGVAHNIGYVLGGALSISLIGTVVGLLVRFGLRKRLPTTARVISTPTISVNPPSDTQSGLKREARFNNFIARNWRGELPLPVSYWVFGFLGNLFVGLVAVLIGGALTENRGYEPRPIFASFALIWLCVLVVAVWQLVGVWRSANRYRHERVSLGKQAFWAGAAQFAVVLGLFRLFVEFGNVGLPQITELYRMAFMDDPDMPSYSVRIMRNGTETEITGGFKYGLTDDFIRILRASPQIRVVHLNSVGGRIGEAEKLYKLIRDRGLITYVSKECHSACTIAFAAGRERWLRDGAVLGFHSPAFPGMSDLDLAESVRNQKELFLSAGFESAFISRALATSNNSMWMPSSGELLRANVITAVSDGSDFAASGYGAEVTREDMTAKLSKALPVLATMKEKLPKDYTSFVDGFYDGYLNGQTESEIFGTARDKLLPLIAAYRPLADDAVLVDLGKLIAEQYAALGRKNPKLCYLYASGAGGTSNFSSDIPAALVKREADLAERVLATAARRPKITEKITIPLWERVYRQLERRVGPEKIALLQNENPTPAEYVEYCTASIALFEEISRLRQNEAGLLMRQIWSEK